MRNSLIFWPMLTQVALTIVAFVLLGARKTRALKAGGVDREKTALDNDAWPDEVLKVSNNIRNQFQVPVLFYALCFIFYNLGAVSAAVLFMAWTFVISRLVHAFIHMGSNYVPARFGAFAVGLVMVLLMAIDAALVLVSG